MEEQLLTFSEFCQLSLKNAEHIEVVNRELGGILEAMKWVKLFIGFQFTFVCATFIAVLRNLHWTKRNGFNNKNAKNTLAK